MCPSDDLVLHCLKCDSSIEARYEIVAMPFESVIEQPSFHDKLGPLFLLRHLHQTHSDPSLQVLFAKVIKRVCSVVMENRTLVERVLADSDASARFLGDGPGEHIDQWLRVLPTGDDGCSLREVHGEGLQCDALSNRFVLERSPSRNQPTNGHTNAVSPGRVRPVSPSSSIGSVTSGGDEENVLDSMEDTEDYLDWYYSPEQTTRRTLIETRVEKALSPSDKSWRRLRERQLAARAKAFRTRMEIFRTKETTLLASFNEEDKKVRGRVESMGANHLRRVQQCVDERCSRAREVRQTPECREVIACCRYIPVWSGPYNVGRLVNGSRFT